MALDTKKNKTIFTKTGDGNDKVEPAKITELDLNARKIKLSVKAAQIDEEKSLIAKFGEGATKSGVTLKGIFEKAIGKKEKKNK